VPNGDLYKASIEGTFNGEPVIIGLGFVSQSEMPDFTSDAVGLAVALGTVLELYTVGGGFMLPLSSHYSVLGIRVQDLNPGLSAGHFEAIPAVGGNTTDDAMPSNDALCVTWKDGLKGKQHRGRSYLTGFAEDSQSGSFWIGEIQNWAVDAFAAPIMAAFGPGATGSYVLSLVHTMSGGARLAPPTSDPIVSYQVHNEVRTLRRRAAGVRISRHRAGA
jgi:hypothetical protein